MQDEEDRRRQMQRTHLRNVPDGIPLPSTLGQTISADHKVSNVDDEGRHDHRDALIEEHGSSYELHSYRTKTKMAQKTASCLRRFVLPFQKPGTLQILQRRSSKRVRTHSGRMIRILRTFQKPTGSRKELFDEEQKEQRQRRSKVAYPLNGGTVRWNELRRPMARHRLSTYVV